MHATWNYHISNAFALHRLDLETMKHRNRSAALRSNEEGRSHVVTVHCDRLTMKVKFDPNGTTIVRPRSGRVIVERLVSDHGEQRWDIVPREVTRCAGSLRVDDREVELNITTPMLRLRYTAAFRLANDGPATHRAGLLAAREVLEKVRAENVPCGREALSARITAELEPKLKEQILGQSTDAESEWLGPDGAWLGMLWHDGRKMLFPAFGRFPLSSWSVRFATGTGVAGQAFRFGAPAA